MPDMRRWMQANHNVSETGGKEVPVSCRMYFFRFYFHQTMDGISVPRFVIV